MKHAIGEAALGLGLASASPLPVLLPHNLLMSSLPIVLVYAVHVFVQDASSAKAEGEAAAEGGGAPKSGDNMDADTTPQEAAPPADGVPPSKTTAATAEPVPETPTPMETDEVEQLE